jgi:hypothetical protein
MTSNHQNIDSTVVYSVVSIEEHHLTKRFWVTCIEKIRGKKYNGIHRLKFLDRVYNSQKF